MKRILYIIGIAAACSLTACSERDLQTKIVEKSISTALTDGSRDSLHLEITLEWPVNGLPPVAMQNIQRELNAAIFGKEFSETSLKQAIELYVGKKEQEYRQNISDLKRILPLDNSQEGVYSWNEMTEGRFLEPYNNMQSYILYKYGYTGGAHGIDSELGLTFSLSTGKQITESDLFVREYKQSLTQLLTEQLPKAVNKDIYDMLFIKAIEPNGNFYIDNEGITYIYGRYEIGPYVSGIVRVTLPWNKLINILK